MLNFVMSPSMEMSEDLGEIGLSFKGVFKEMKRHVRKMDVIHRGLRRLIIPKKVRRAFNKKTFVKYAPILAGVAQVLNVIPGLGIAVGAAIMAGAAAITVAATVIAKQEAKKAAKKAENDEIAQSDAAFAQSNGYFTEKYGVTAAQFHAMPLEERMNFLQVATEDAEKEAKEGTGIFSLSGKVSKASVGSGGGWVIVAIVVALFLFRRSSP